MTLRTRKPTGAVPWPLVLIEGGEKSGKSWALAELSASPRVGQTYWIDLGEGAGDEYGAVPGARYELVEHNGTFAEILDAVVEIKALAAKAAAAGEPPVVIGIDSGTAEWDLLKGIADAKARARLAKKGRTLPVDVEPVISMDLWNEINAKHKKLMKELMTFPGIAVITARGKETASMDSSGRPVEGSKEYKVEGQKGLAFDASVWVRVSREHAPMVVGARSVHAGIQPGVDKPRQVPGLTLEKVVFEILKCDPATAHVRDLVELSTEDDQAQDRPSERAFELLTQIGAAGDKDQLGAAWKAIGAALNASEISQPEADKLSEHWKRRKAEVLAEPKNPGNDPARRRMMALFTQCEITDRETRLAYCADVVGHDVSTTNALTDDEVQAVCTKLDSFIKQMEPAGAVSA